MRMLERKNPRPPEIKATRVYVLKSNAGYVKIGVSRAPKRRMSGIQSGVPIRLELFFQLKPEGKTAFEVEREAMRLLAARRVSGEWFDCHPLIAKAAVEVAATGDERAGLLLRLGLDLAAADKWSSRPFFDALYVEFPDEATMIEPISAGIYRLVKQAKNGGAEKHPGQLVKQRRIRQRPQHLST